MMRELHLFAGAGGGILGGMLLGHTPVGAVEIDPFARAVLHARKADGSLPDFPIYEDVRDFDGTAWRDRVDIIAGGFPCQDLSCAGKGAGIDGARSGLWWEMLRVIREARPRYVFLENVPAITGRGLDRVLGSLADLGFDAEWCVLSAADVGAPHLRKRWWCLARDTSCNDADALAGISQRQDPEPAGNGATVADSSSEQNYGRGRGSMDSAESSGKGLDASAVTGCADVADANGRRCEQRDADERSVSESEPDRAAVADSHAEWSGRRQQLQKMCQRARLLADADDAGREQQRRTVAASTGHDPAECSGPAHPDTDGRRCEEQRLTQQPDMQCAPGHEPDGLRPRGRWHGAPGCAAGSAETQPRVGRAADGLAAWLDAGRRLHASAWQEGWEDDCPRVVTGKPANRTNRLKALGNGQVPQTAAAAFRILWERLHR